MSDKWSYDRLEHGEGDVGPEIKDWLETIDSTDSTSGFVMNPTFSLSLKFLTMPILINNKNLR